MKLQYLILILLLPQLSAPVQSQVPEPVIASYSHTPLSPVPGMEITFLATLNLFPAGFDNVTIVFSINGQNETRGIMQNLGGNQFQYILEGQENGTVINYWLELYVQDSLEDRKPASGSEQITVLDLPFALINIRYGLPVDLPFGNFTLISEEGHLSLNLTLNSGITITITRTPLNEATPPTNFHAVSDKFTIDVNSTEPIDQAIIQLQYDQQTVDSLSADEGRLKLLKIENEKVEVVNGTVNIIENTITATTKSFSEWIISSEKPNLKVIDLTADSSARPGELFTLGFVLTNLGNSKAVNVTLLIFLPFRINIVNNSSRFQFNELKPLQNITFALNLLAEQLGNYTIVITVEADEGVQESEPISVSIGEAVRSNNANALAYTTLIPFLVLIIARRKRNS